MGFNGLAQSFAEFRRILDGIIIPNYLIRKYNGTARDGLLALWLDQIEFNQHISKSS